MRCVAFLILSFSHFLVFTAAAQTTFTQRLQQSKAGEGKVTLTQEKAIDDLVNGNARQTDTHQKQADGKATTATTSQKPDSTKTAENTQREGEDENAPVDNRKKVIRGGYKVNGYRVQAFAGGSQRKDRIQAEQIGNTIKRRFPNVPVYVHFYAPRWLCRVGNYRTYEEAYKMLLDIRKQLGIAGASVVKTRVTVPYMPQTTTATE